MVPDYRIIALHRGLFYNGNSLPYNPKLKSKARELRNNPTPEERLMWRLLRRLPFQALRQRTIDHFIVDFYFPRKKAVLEIDGSQHFSHSGLLSDAERTKILEMYGVTVIRASNAEVRVNAEAIVMRIVSLPDRRG